MLDHFLTPPAARMRLATACRKMDTEAMLVARQQLNAANLAKAIAQHAEVLSDEDRAQLARFILSGGK